MTSKILVALTFLLFGTTIKAQSSYFDASETAPFKDTRRATGLEGIYTFTNGKVVAVRSSKKQLMVSDFNDNYKLTSDIELDLERKESYLASSSNDNLIRVFTVLKVDRSTREVYCHTYNVDSKEVQKAKLYTAKESGKRGGSPAGPKKHDENFRVSPNGEYLAFAVTNVNNKTNSYSIRVFDTQLNEVYNTSYYDDIERFFQFDDFIVTNAAEVICSGKLYIKGKREKKKGKANYDYVIHKVSADTNESSNLKLEDNFINELRFSQTEDAIKLFGFYSEKSTAAMKGALSYSFNGTNITDVQLKESPFPESIYKDIYREAKAERLKEKERELRNFYLDFAFVDEQGNSYLIAEEFYITQTSGGAVNGGFTTQTQYHYDDILVMKFDPEGNLIWGRAVLKKDGASSYNAFILDGKLHLLLNTGKNVKEKSDGRKKVKRGIFTSTALFDIIFDETSGEPTFEMLRENKGKTTYRPYLGNFDYDTFILANTSKSKKQFLILKKK